LTIGYTYFGLSGKVAPKLEDANDIILITATKTPPGSDGREEAGLTDWRDETRSSVIKTYHELANEIDRNKDAASKRWNKW